MNTSGWKPTGHRVLVKVTKIEEITQGGIIIPKEVTKREQLGQDGGIVVEIGNTAYSDQESPWCKVGDFILARPNSGTRLKIHGREFRILNDDSVEGIVQDPRGITRV